MKPRSRLSHPLALAVLASFFVSASTETPKVTEASAEVLKKNGSEAISAEMYQTLDAQSSPESDAAGPDASVANNINRTASPSNNASSTPSDNNQGKKSDVTGQPTNGKKSKDDVSKPDASSVNKTVAAGGEQSTESIPPVVPLASNTTESSTPSPHVSRTEEMPSAESTSVPEVNTLPPTKPDSPSESTKPPKPTEATPTPNNATTNTTNQSSNETTPLPTAAPETIGNSSQAEAISASKSGDDDASSAGVFALVMAISFTIVVIIVYFGLVAWRRYLEYKYGNRELLVNDLEFDTNDLHHFEL